MRSKVYPFPSHRMRGTWWASPGSWLRRRRSWSRSRTGRTSPAPLRRTAQPGGRRHRRRHSRRGHQRRRRPHRHGPCWGYAGLGMRLFSVTRRCLGAMVKDSLALWLWPIYGALAQVTNKGFLSPYWVGYCTVAHLEFAYFAYICVICLSATDKISLGRIRDYLICVSALFASSR